MPQQSLEVFAALCSSADQSEVRLRTPAATMATHVAFSTRELLYGRPSTTVIDLLQRTSCTPGVPASLEQGLRQNGPETLRQTQLLIIDTERNKR